VDEGTRTGGPAIDEQARGPAEIREDIAQTREELGETVEALAAKTHVKGQAKAKLEDARERAIAKIDAAKRRVEAASPAGDAKERALAKLDAAKQRVGAASADDAKGLARAGVGAVRERVGAARGGTVARPQDAAGTVARRLKRTLAEKPMAFAAVAAIATGLLLRSRGGRR
jgi:hypothetical protein